MLFKEILTFLGLAYRDASLKTLYLVVIGISINNKIKKCCQNGKESTCFKWTYVHSDNDYSVATLPKTVTDRRTKRP